jgi:chemotaxis protein histidine kinase CheA
MQTLNDSTNTNVSIQITALDALMNLAGELVLGRNPVAASHQAPTISDFWKQPVSAATS